MRTWKGSYALMRSWLPVALWLWLGTAAVVAAAPRVGPRAAGRTQLDRSNLATVAAGTVVPTVADVITEQDCPGIQANGTSCGKVRGGLQQHLQLSALAMGPRHSWLQHPSACHTYANFPIHYIVSRRYCIVHQGTQHIWGRAFCKHVQLQHAEWCLLLCCPATDMSAATLQGACYLLQD